MKSFIFCAVVVCGLGQTAALAAELTCTMTGYSTGKITSNNTAADTTLGLNPEKIIPAEAVHRLDGSLSILNGGAMTGAVNETVTRIKIGYRITPSNGPAIDVNYSYSKKTGAMVAGAVIHHQIPRQIARITGSCTFSE